VIEQKPREVVAVAHPMRATAARKRRRLYVRDHDPRDDAWARP
jgi:hypothetical protein